MAACLPIDARRKLVTFEGALSVVHQCELLGLNRAGLYYQPVGESRENLELMRLIDAQYIKTPFYGSRRMTAWLVRKGHTVNRKRVQRLMRLMGIEGIHPRKGASRSSQEHEVLSDVNYSCRSATTILAGIALTDPNTATTCPGLS